MATNNEDVIVFKLASGEEIIARAKDYADGSMELYRPYVFVVQQDPQTGNTHGSLASYMQLGLSDSVHMMQRPVAIAVPSPEALETYLKSIGEKVIETPSKKIIL